MTMPQLRLLAPDTDSIISDDLHWQQEPVFSPQKTFFDVSIETDHWDLLWQGNSDESAQWSVKKPKLRVVSQDSLYLAKQFDAYAPLLAHRYAHRSAVTRRIAELRKLSSASNDLFSETSAELALSACEELATDIKPGIFLLPNGNLRALWRNQARESLGIQFLPDGDLQYVILHRGRTKMLQALGVEEDVSGLSSKVRSFGLERLWVNGKR